MDFRSLKRRELQALCKVHGFPANLTNLQMADLLTTALLQVKGNSTSEEDNEKDCNDAPKKLKKVRFSRDVEIREYETSVYQRPSRRIMRTSLANQTASKVGGQTSVSDDKIVGNKKGRAKGEKIGSVGRITRSRAKVDEESTSCVVENKIETFKGSDGVSDDKEVVGKKRGRASGEKIESVCRTTRSRARVDEESTYSVIEKKVEIFKGRDRCVKVLQVDEEPVKRGRRFCQRQKSKELKNEEGSKNIAGNSVEAIKGVRRSTTNAAGTCVGPQVMKVEVIGRITRSGAQSEGNSSAIDGGDKVGIAKEGTVGVQIKESSKGFGRNGSRRKSVAQVNANVGTDGQELLNAVNKVKVSEETSKDRRKASLPASGPRRSRRKTVVMNSTVSVVEQGTGGSVERVKQLNENEIRKSTRNASRHSSVATPNEMNEVSDIVQKVLGLKQKSEVVQRKKTSVVMEGLFVGVPPRRSTRRALKSESVGHSVPCKSVANDQQSVSGMPLVIEEILFPNISPSEGEDTELTVPRAIGEKKDSSINTCIDLKISEKKGKSKSKSRGRSIASHNVSAVHYDTGEQLDAATNLEETQTSTPLKMADACTEEEASKILGHCVVTNEDIVMETLHYDIGKETDTVTNLEEAVASTPLKLEDASSSEASNIAGHCVDINENLVLETLHYDAVEEIDTVKTMEEILASAPLKLADISTEEDASKTEGQCLADASAEEDASKTQGQCTVSNEQNIVLANDARKLVSDNSIEGGEADECCGSWEICENLYNYNSAELKLAELVSLSDGFTSANQSTFGGESSNLSGYKKGWATKEGSTGKDACCGNGNDGINNGSAEVHKITIEEDRDCGVEETDQENTKDELDHKLVSGYGKSSTAASADIFVKSSEEICQESDDAIVGSTKIEIFVQVDGVSSLERIAQESTTNKNECKVAPHTRKNTVVEDTKDTYHESDNASNHSAGVDRKYVYQDGVSGLHWTGQDDATDKLQHEVAPHSGKSCFHVTENFRSPLEESVIQVAEEDEVVSKENAGNDTELPRKRSADEHQDGEDILEPAPKEDTSRDYSANTVTLKTFDTRLSFSAINFSVERRKLQEVADENTVMDNSSCEDKKGVLESILVDSLSEFNLEDLEEGILMSTPMAKNSKDEVLCLQDVGDRMAGKREVSFESNSEDHKFQVGSAFFTSWEVNLIQGNEERGQVVKLDEDPMDCIFMSKDFLQLMCADQDRVEKSEGKATEGNLISEDSELMMSTRNLTNVERIGQVAEMKFGEALPSVKDIPIVLDEVSAINEEFIDEDKKVKNSMFSTDEGIPVESSVDKCTPKCVAGNNISFSNIQHISETDEENEVCAATAGKIVILEVVDVGETALSGFSDDVSHEMAGTEQRKTISSCSKCEDVGHAEILSFADTYCGKPEISSGSSFPKQKANVSYELFVEQMMEDEVIVGENGKTQEAGEDLNVSANGPFVETNAGHWQEVPQVQLNVHPEVVNEAGFMDDIDCLALNELASDNKSEIHLAEAAEEHCLHKLDDEVITFVDFNKMSNLENHEAVSPFKSEAVVNRSNIFEVDASSNDVSEVSGSHLFPGEEKNVAEKPVVKASHFNLTIKDAGELKENAMTGQAAIQFADDQLGECEHQVDKVSQQKLCQIVVSDYPNFEQAEESKMQDVPAKAHENQCSIANELQEDESNKVDANICHDATPFLQTLECDPNNMKKDNIATLIIEDEEEATELIKDDPKIGERMNDHSLVFTTSGIDQEITNGDGQKCQLKFLSSQATTERPEKEEEIDSGCSLPQQNAKASYKDYEKQMMEKDEVMLEENGETQKDGEDLNDLPDGSSLETNAGYLREFAKEQSNVLQDSANESAFIHSDYLILKKLCENRSEIHLTDAGEECFLHELGEKVLTVGDSKKVTNFESDDAICSFKGEGVVDCPTVPAVSTSPYETKDLDLNLYFGDREEYEAEESGPFQVNLMSEDAWESRENSMNNEQAAAEFAQDQHRECGHPIDEIAQQKHLRIATSHEPNTEQAEESKIQKNVPDQIDDIEENKLFKVEANASHGATAPDCIVEAAESLEHKPKMSAPEVNQSLAFTTSSEGGREDITAGDGQNCELELLSPEKTSSIVEKEPNVCGKYLTCSVIKRKANLIGLIQGTPQKVLDSYVMKENPPLSIKKERVGNVTAARTLLKRRPLEDLTRN